MDEIKGTGQMKREVDSMDDFEHLGHDSSPLKEKVETGDLLGLGHQEINKRVETAGGISDVTDVPNTVQKVDSKLQQMDHFPDIQPSEEQKIFNVDKRDIQSFIDGERELLQEQVKIRSDNNDRYSSNEPELEDFHKNQPELPKFFDTKEHFKNNDDAQIHSIKSEKVDHLPEPEKERQLPKQEEEVAKNETKPINKETEPVKQQPDPKPQKVVEAPPKVVVDVHKPKIAPADAEAIFCKIGLDTWFNPEKLNPKVESLIYWRDPKKSGPVFGGVLIVLLALTYFSLISVIAYLSLIALTGTIAFRIYKNVVQAVQKTGDGHPFKDFLELDIALPQDKVREIVDVAVAHLNAAVIELRRLFLVEDLVDSIKFGVMLWTLTYVGAWFNGMTLIIIAWVAFFTLPKVYETNKTQIDTNLEIVRTKLAEITSKVKAAIPIGKKPEEKKEQ